MKLLFTKQLCINTPVIFLYKAFCVFVLFLGLAFNAKAGDETIPAGSLIINMGNANPTIAKSLKPYGLIYDLLKNQYCPVKWVINPNKTKDGADFTLNGVAYKGGPFIITAPFRTTAVNTVINTWVAAWGIDTACITTATTLPVYITLTAAPRWTLDATNGAIAQTYLTNAGVPSSAYNWKAPALLGPCDDLFAMPHADPIWTTHGNLYNWSKSIASGGYKGGIYLSCHAGSVFENMFNPANNTQQCNLLSTDPAVAGGQSMVLFGSHGNGSIPPPYIMQYPADACMQFIGKIDAALQAGSEQIFLPKIGWRTSTHVGIYDDSQADVPSKSPGPAAALAYGYAKGDSAAGYVMIMGAHTMAKATTADYINGQRVFLNWSFLASQSKAVAISVPTTLSGTISQGETISLSVTASGYSTPFTYAWSSSVAGSFSAPTASSTTFTPTSLSARAIIHCIVTDACGRVGFYSASTNVISGLVIPNTPLLSVTIANSCITENITKTVDVLASASSPSGRPLTLSLLTAGHHGTFVNNGNGTVTYTPELNFTGIDSCTYQVCDNAVPQNCSSNLLVINLGANDIYGCSPNQVYGVVSFGGIDTLASATSNVSSTVSNAYDLVDGTFATYAAGDSASFKFTEFVYANDTMSINWKSGSGTSSISVMQSADGTTYSNRQTYSTTSTLVIVSNYKITSAAKYIRIARTAGTPGLDAVVYTNNGCVTRAPEANSDAVAIVEDSSATIGVLLNDIDPQSLALTVTSIFTQPAHGKVSINLNNTITYAPNADYSGSDQFVYQATNTEGYSDTTVVNLTIVDDGCAAGFYKPVTGSVASVTIPCYADAAMKQSSTSNYGSSTTFKVGYSSSAIRRDMFQFDLVTGSPIPAGSVLQSATLNLVASGTVNALNLGIYAFTNSWAEASTTWALRSTGNSWTTAGGDFSATSYGTFNTVSGTTNYNINLSSLVQEWYNGTRTNYGLLIKTITEPASTSVSFCAKENTTAGNRPTLTVTYATLGSCTAVRNRAPLSNPDNASTLSSTPVNINVKSNDADPDGNTLNVPLIITNPSNGSVTVNGDGTIKYTPSGSFNGITTFTYSVSDGTLKDTSKVFVTVLNSVPVATNDSTGTNSGTSKTISVKANDADTEADTLTNPVVTLGANNGSATVSGNKIIYTPFDGFTGVDSFFYAIYEQNVIGCGGAQGDTARVKITIGNLPPDAKNDTVNTNACQPVAISVMNNDNDPENGSLTVSIRSNPSNGALTLVGGVMNYTPNSSLGFGASDNFTYYLTDNGSPAKTDSATVFVNINASTLNNKPVALDDLDTSGQKNQDMYVDVITNDADADNDPLEVSLPSGILQPAHGTITILNNLIKYVPAYRFVGLDSFEYVLSDVIPAAAGGCPTVPSKSDTAKVIIGINEWDLMIRGSIYNDQNGTSDNAIYGDLVDSLNSQPLYINLIDNSTGLIVGTTTVENDGTFYLGYDNGTAQNTTFKIVLSINQGTIGGTVAPELPAGWGFAGEGTSGAGDGTLDGLTLDALTDASITLNFAIDQIPVSHKKIYANLNAADYINHSGNLTYPNRIILSLSESDTSVIDYSGTIPPGKLSGSDPDGSRFGGITGNTEKVAFTSLPNPANAVLVYSNGSTMITLDPSPSCPAAASCTYWNAAASRYEIPAFNPNSLFLYMNNNVLSTSFTYAFFDSANVISVPDTYMVSFNSPLPVTLVAFGGKLNKNEQSELNWITSSELNNSYFDVEYSTNGEFYKIGTIKGNGTTFHYHDYAFIHLTPAVGDNYYRLKQVDYNGKTAYSEVINIPYSKKVGPFAITPNPTHGELNIQYEAISDDDVNISVTNLLGQVLYQNQYNSSIGLNALNLNLQYWEPGIYFVNFTFNGETITQKITLVN